MSPTVSSGLQLLRHFVGLRLACHKAVQAVGDVGLRILGVFQGRGVRDDFLVDALFERLGVVKDVEGVVP